MVTKMMIVFAMLCWRTLAVGQATLMSGEHREELNGVKLWYRVAGTGKQGTAPLLFLHGGPGYNSYSFERTIGIHLEKYVQMVYLDERGSGRSERPANANYTMTTLVSDVEALRRSLGVPKLSIMGHSFGGTIALEYAARYPEHVEKLIIVDGAADMPFTFALWRREIEQRYPSAWRSTLDGSVGERLKEAELGRDGCVTTKAEFAAEMSTLKTVDAQAFHDWQQFHKTVFEKEQRSLDEASGLKNTGEFSAAYFGPASQFPCYRFTAFNRLTMPALVMVGKFDGVIGVAQMRSLASHLPAAHFDEFNKSAHFVYAEQPKKFVKDVVDFLISGR